MDLFGRLDGVRQLAEIFKAVDVAALSTHEGAWQDFVAEVVPQTFMTSFALKHAREPQHLCRLTPYAPCGRKVRAQSEQAEAGNRTRRCCASTP